MKKEMVGNVPGNVLGMLADLAHKLQHGVITPDQLAGFLQGKKSFGPEFSDLKIEWERFYQKVFNMTLDFSELDVPEKQRGFNWLLIMVEGLTPQKLFNECKKHFKVFQGDINLNTIRSKRTSERTYAVWVRDRIEADEENKNRSANSLDSKGITLEERFLLELFFHWRTNKHLDIKNATYCTGTRDDEGMVPSVRWYDGKMDTSEGYGPGCEEDDLRARSVIY